VRGKAVDSIAKTCYEKRRQALLHRLLIIQLWTHTQSWMLFCQFSIFTLDSGSDFGIEDMGPHILCFERTEQTLSHLGMFLSLKTGSQVCRKEK